MKHLVGQKWFRPRQGRRDRIPPLPCLSGHPERGEHRGDVSRHRRLIQCDPKGVRVHHAQVHAALARGAGDLHRASRGPYGDGVEPRIVHEFDARGVQCVRKAARSPMDPRRDRGQPFRPVVHRVQTGDDREQDLGGADVARRLLPTDVLLACLQREPQRAPALGVNRHANQAARQRTFVRVSARDVSGMRSPVSERNSEALRRTDDEVRAHCTRRLQQHQCKEVCGHRNEAAFVVHACDQHGVVDHGPTAAWVREQHAEDARTGNVLRWIPDDHLDVKRFRATLHDCDGLGVTIGIEEEDVAALGREPATHGHGLGRGGRFVEQGRIRQVHAGEVGHHRLEVEERLESTLGDLGLIRRVRGVPRRVLQHVAADHARSDGVRVAHADH